MDSIDADFERWYRLVHPRLVASLANALGNHDLARDAADEAIVRAFERWAYVSTMSSPTGWAYRVGFNVARRRLRRRALETRLLHRDRSDDSAAPSGELWVVVAQLPERQRHAVVLRHVGHLREAEIAQAMGITRGAVSASLRAAYRTLRMELNEGTPVAKEIS